MAAEPGSLDLHVLLDLEVLWIISQVSSPSSYPGPDLLDLCVNLHSRNLLL